MLRNILKQILSLLIKLNLFKNTRIFRLCLVGRYQTFTDNEEDIYMHEVVIVAGVRSPVGIFGKALREVSAVEIGKQVLERLMEKVTLGKEEILPQEMLAQ